MFKKILNNHKTLGFINTLFEYGICGVCLSIILFGAYSLLILVAA